MPASRAASSRGMPSSALASASRRALTHPSRSRRARRRSSAGSWSVRIGKGAGMAASPKTMPPERLRRPIDPSPVRPAGISQALRERIKQAGEDGSLIALHKLPVVLHAWREIGFEEEPRAWTERQIADDGKLAKFV